MFHQEIVFVALVVGLAALALVAGAAVAWAVSRSLAERRVRQAEIDHHVIRVNEQLASMLDRAERRTAELHAQLVSDAEGAVRFRRTIRAIDASVESPAGAERSPTPVSSFRMPGSGDDLDDVGEGGNIMHEFGSA